MKNIEERSAILEYLKNNDILSVFHYVPLHSSPAGLKFGKFIGEDKFTTKESECLIRLPIYYGMSSTDIKYILNKVALFTEQKTEY